MADLIRLSILGSLPGGEEWSVNPCFDILTGSVVTFAEANAIVTAVNAVSVPTALRAAMNTTTLVTGCRVEARTAAGVLETLAEGLRGTTVAGTGTTPHPGQTSWVISLRSNTPGASGRGRLYWPATGQSVAGATLRPTSTETATFASGWSSFLSSLQTAVDGVIDETIALGVWSRKNATLYQVTRLLAGDVLDTQRRRRDTLPESYSEVTYP